MRKKENREQAQLEAQTAQCRERERDLERLLRDSWAGVTHVQRRLGGGGHWRGVLARPQRTAHPRPNPAPLRRPARPERRLQQRLHRMLAVVKVELCFSDLRSVDGNKAM